MAAELASALVKGEKETEGVHYRVDEKQRSVLMTEEGYEAAENCLGVSPLLLCMCFRSPASCSQSL